MSLLPPEVPGPNPGQPGHYAHHDWLTGSVKAIDTEAQRVRDDVARGYLFVANLIVNYQFGGGDRLPGASFTLNAEAGRWYRVVYAGNVQMSSADGHAYMAVMVDGVVVRQWAEFIHMSQFASFNVEHVFQTTAGNHLLEAFGSNSAGATNYVQGTVNSPVLFSVEDVGLSTAASRPGEDTTDRPEVQPA